MNELNPKVWIALDVPSLVAAETALRQLVQAKRPFGVKVGMELTTAVGLPSVIGLCQQTFGIPTFVDLKFKDIPNTVAGAAKALRLHKPAIFNVHASGGVRMMQAAVESCGESQVFAVTVLTSMDDAKQESIASYGAPAAKAAMRFAGMAADAGCHGVICSPLDLASLRGNGCDSLLKLCPGVRPAWMPTKGDQSRVATPADAVAAGADGVVVGRPVLNPPDGVSVREALRRVADEVRVTRLFQLHGGLLDGHFVLKSGRHSNRYLNKDVLFPHDTVMDEVAFMLAAASGNLGPIDCVVGPESAGAKLAAKLGEFIGCRSVGVKKDGTGGFVAPVLNPNERILLVEDVLTTGGSVSKVHDLIKVNGNEIVGVLGLINRGGVQMPGLQTLATMNADSWLPEECPLCKSGVPINTNVGHGGNKAK